MKKLIYTLLLLVITQLSFSQELLCEVSVVAPDVSKIQSDPKVFKTLENAISEFMNNTKWSTEVYGDNEKIDCSIFIAIKKQTGNFYSGTLTLISKRPVFNSSYQTTILNIIDNDILFSYKEFEPIEIAENQFVSNLSHLLAFYANMIIAMDKETFENKGGEIYLQKANELVNVVGSANGSKYKGWRSVDKNKRSRYWLVTNLLNPRFENFRTAFYQYYREGLDNFYSDDVLARTNIKKALQNLAKVSLDDPNISIMQMWSETKSKETIEMFKGAPEGEKTAIVNLLKKVDPVNANKYDVIMK